MNWKGSLVKVLKRAGGVLRWMAGSFLGLRWGAMWRWFWRRPARLAVLALSALGSGFSFSCAVRSVSLSPTIVIPVEWPALLAAAPARPEPSEQGWIHTELRHPRVKGAVHVLSQQLGWALESSDVVELEGSSGPAGALDELEKYLQKPGLKSYMKTATDLILVGTASCEGNRAAGRELAAQRLNVLSHVLTQVRPRREEDDDPLFLHLLNLGRFGCRPYGDAGCHGFKPEETKNQRRIILITVEGSDSPGELDREALQAALRQKSFEVPITDYCGFEGFELRPIN